MKKNIFIVILVLIILGLGGYLVYDKVIDKDEKVDTTDNKSKKQEEKTKQHTYKNMEGKYYGEADAKIEEMPGAMSKHFLILSSDGTFSYKSIENTARGYLGNYIIDNDTIILNKLFCVDSGAGVQTCDGSDILKIDESDNLVMNVSSTIGEVKLSKTETSDNKFAEVFVKDFKETIDNEELVNSYSKNNNSNN